MVVRGNAEWFDTTVHKELGQTALDLSLARLEVVSANEPSKLLGELDTPRNKSVLRGTVDIGGPFVDASHGEDG
jgi:hypothetical protein